MGNRSSVNSTHSRLRDTRIHIVRGARCGSKESKGKEVAEGMEWKDARNKWSFPRGEEGGEQCHAPTRLTRCRTPRDALLLSSRPTVNRLYLHLVMPWLTPWIPEWITYTNWYYNRIPSSLSSGVPIAAQAKLFHGHNRLSLHRGRPIIPCLDLSRSRINANGVTLLSPVMQMRDRRFRLVPIETH